MTTIPAIDTISIGRPKTVGPVTLYPLYWHGPTALPYVTLAEAIAAGTVTVEEAPSANVPTLLVSNTGTLPVLITDGEILEGGWQNRTVTVPVLVEPGEIAVPVACVEAGRWGGGRQARFGKSVQRLPRRIRRTVTRTVEATPDGRRYVDQSAVWSGVASALEDRHVASDTRSLLDVSACISLDAPLDQQSLPPNIVAVDRAVRVLRALRPLPLQTGLVVAIGGRCVSAEVFDRPETLAGYWDEILAAIALDVPARVDGRRPSIAAALRFVRRVLKADVERAPGVGLGTEYRFTSDRIAAQALAVEDRLVCLSVIAA